MGAILWWEHEAQAYIISKGFRNRQLSCIDPTSNNNRYRNKLTGDSPEICRGLDSHGFADLVTCIKRHTSLSSIYSIDDPRRFNMGTPSEVWSTMSRCWDIEPTSDRIIQDIQYFEAVLDKIIASKGCIVSDENLRHGRRCDGWKSKYGKDIQKPRNRQKKDTLGQQLLLHADCQDAYDKLSMMNMNIEDLAVHENIEIHSVSDLDMDNISDIEFLNNEID